MTGSLARKKPAYHWVWFPWPRFAEKGLVTSANLRSLSTAQTGWLDLIALDAAFLASDAASADFGRAGSLPCVPGLQRMRRSLWQVAIHLTLEAITQAVTVLRGLPETVTQTKRRATGLREGASALLAAVCRKTLSGSCRWYQRRSSDGHKSEYMQVSRHGLTSGTWASNPLARVDLSGGRSLLNPVLLCT